MDGTDFHDYDAKSRAKKGKNHKMVNLRRRELARLSGVTKRVEEEGLMHDLSKREVENYVNSIPDNMAVGITYSFNKARRWEKAMNGRLLDDVPSDVEAEVHELLHYGSYFWGASGAGALPSTAVHCRNHDGSISTANSKKVASHGSDLAKKARAKKTMDDGSDSAPMGPRVTYEIARYMPNTDCTRKWYNTDNSRRSRRAGAFHVENDDLDSDFGDENDDEDIPNTSNHTIEDGEGTSTRSKDIQISAPNRPALKVSLEECVIPSKEKLPSDWVLV